MPESNEHFTLRPLGAVRVIELTRPDLTDAVYIKRLGDAIYHRLKDEEQPQVVLDFARVRQLSSSLLGMLIALDKVVKKQEGRLRLANVNGDIAQVFKLTKLNRLLRMFQSTDAAVKSLQ